MKDFAINTTTGELLRKDGDLYYVSGDDWIRQKLEIHLKFFYGEWFLDTTQGVKYFEAVLVKNPNLRTVESVLKAAIMEVDGIEEITDFNLIYSAGGRSCTLVFSVQTVNSANSLTVSIGQIP